MGLPCPPLRPGMAVLGSDGQPLGEIKEVYQTSFLIDRPLHYDIVVPCEGIQDVIDNQVVLGISSDQVDDIHWDTPA